MNKKLLFLIPVLLLVLSIIPNINLYKDKSNSPPLWKILSLNSMCSENKAFTQEKITSCTCNGLNGSNSDNSNEVSKYGFPIAALTVEDEQCSMPGPTILFSWVWLPVDLAFIGGSLAFAMKANNIHLRKPKNNTAKSKA
jgi:hypothetical protein